jgi:hypothetical protein
LKSPARTFLKWTVSLGIGALFIHLALADWPLDRMLEGGLHVQGAYLLTGTWRLHLAYLPLYFLTLIVMHIFRFWRWQPLLDPLHRVDLWTLNRVCSVGFMAVFLLPMRLGELVRPALISTEAPIRRSAALATIVVERVVDGVMVAGFLAVALVFMPRTHFDSFVQIRIATYLTLAVFGGAVVGLLLLFAFRNPVRVFMQGMMVRVSGRRFAVRFGGFLERFLGGLSVFPDWKNFLWFLVLSFFYWFSNGIGLFLLAQGFEVAGEGGNWAPFAIPLLGAFAMMSTIVVGMMIPNAPANVGSFWYFLLKPIELYGVLPGNPAALAYALTVWTLQLLQLLLFGGWFLVRGQVSWRRAFAMDSAGTV